MAKKTTASKPLPPMYIAIDDISDQVIALGPRETVLEVLREYCYDEDWDEDDIESCVTVYELGKQIELQVEKQLELFF